MQWGKAESPGNGPGYGTINFGMDFKDKYYSLMITPLYPNSSYPAFIVSVTNYSNKQATVYFRTNDLKPITGVSAGWFAIGKWK